MARRSRIVTKVARAGSSPLRGYFNRSFEDVKDEVRRAASEERQATTHDVDALLVAIGRLEEAIGFLGLQITQMRADIDEVRAERAGDDASGVVEASPAS